MGLIKAGIEATKGVLEDQYRDYFYCEGLTSDVLVKKGVRRQTKRGTNKGNENIISNGSIIAVNDGQCMMIVEQGKVVELCQESGEFIYDTSTEPSIFYDGNFMDNLKETFKQIGKRFTFGGEPAKDQRIYFFNTKEIIGNKYGTPAPIPFRVVDRNVGLDIDISIRSHGEYSYRITNPLLFYTNVTGNVENEFTRDTIDGQLKSEFMTALQPAFAQISALGVRYSEVPAHTIELANALNKVLSDKWQQTRGIQVGTIGVSTMKASEEDEQMIKQLQRNAAFRDPSMGAAQITGAQADAMMNAAKNENGAIGGFMGMGMAQNAGGVNAGDLYKMGAQNQQKNEEQASKDTGWACSCGTRNTGKFCSNCGKQKPEKVTWQCSCGKENEGKFCSDCGKAKPTATTCSNCGYEVVGSQIPKFCPECGQAFEQ
ncbi:SPFH domain-containing protein [Kurthia senegalensis]|uniref:SPFH domain-containing protein n=1 Tax=Kurthia senegalensis TaxID=1033740 RepID=UPI0002884079|nr:SPFH domain-containing protein [Kurthia senegalensis]